MSSLGAIAYHVFAGHAPADNPLDLPTLLREGNGLRLSSAVNGVGAWLEELVHAATAPVVRPRDARLASSEVVEIRRGSGCVAAV